MTEEVISVLRRWAQTLRFVIGAPDYDRYADHMRSAHPNAKPLTRAEFANERLKDRYSKAGSRCC